MKKILNDRLNHLKSKLKEYKNPKMDRRGQDPFILQDFNSRIQEIKWLLNKIKDE